MDSAKASRCLQFHAPTGCGFFLGGVAEIACLNRRRTTPKVPVMIRNGARFRWFSERAERGTGFAAAERSATEHKQEQQSGVREKEIHRREPRRIETSNRSGKNDSGTSRYDSRIVSFVRGQWEVLMVCLGCASKIPCRRCVFSHGWNCSHCAISEFY